MKIKDYIKELQAIAKKHPNLEVVYATDDEGNSFNYVQYNPSVGTVEVDGVQVEAVTLN